MRIGIDARILVGPTTGASRVVASLLGELYRFPEHHFVVFHRKDFSDRNAMGANVTLVELDVPVATLSNLFLTGWKVRRLALDSYYYPFVDVPLWVDAPTAAVVYDLYYLWDRTYFSSFSRIRHLLTRLLTLWRLSVARALLPISQTTAEQIRRLPFARNGDIRVVHMCSPVTLTAGEMDISDYAPALRSSPFFLYVGNNRNHKNLDLLIRAFDKASGRVAGWKLVMSGSIDPRYSDPRATAARCASAARIVHLGHVSDAVLEALYRRAGCVVIPSLYEGFGLPALEAALRGKAVMCSDIGSLREVLGSAPRYCGPSDAADWSNAMVELANDSALRESIARHCADRALLFSSERFARETIDALVAIGTKRTCAASGVE